MPAGVADPAAALVGLLAVMDRQLGRNGSIGFVAEASSALESAALALGFLFADAEDLTRLARQEDEMPLPHPHFEAEQNVDGEDAPAKRAVNKVGEPAKTAEDDAWLVSLEQACKP